MMIDIDEMTCVMIQHHLSAVLAYQALKKTTNIALAAEDQSGY